MVILRNTTFVIVVNSRHAESSAMNRTDIIEIIKSGSESWTQAITAQVSESSRRASADLWIHPSRGSTGGGRIVEIQRFRDEDSFFPVQNLLSTLTPRSTLKRIDEVVIERIHIISERRVERANTKSQKEEMSGVGFLAAVKTFTPGGRRRRRCEKQQKVLELPPGYAMQPDVVPCWDAAPPITPPAAFLPPGYKKGFPGELIFVLCFMRNATLWRKISL